MAEKRVTLIGEFAILAILVFGIVFLAVPEYIKISKSEPMTFITEQGEVQRFYYDGWISYGVNPEGNVITITFENYKDNSN